MNEGKWYEEYIQEDLKIGFILKQVLFEGKSEFQDMSLVDTSPYGKVLLLDGKIQSTEADEFVYHELLVHPALLHHPNPKSVFICGGGEGATAREVLRHKSVEQVVMVDIDKVVCDFCKLHLTENTAAFNDERLQLINADAASTLEKYDQKFDVIIGDLADPVFGGPCYHLYTQEFYQNIIKQKLAEGGIFVTQSGPGGVLSCSDIFLPVHSTLKSVFPVCLPYTAHVPSFTDEWGWNIGFSDENVTLLSAADLDARIAETITGELKFLDGITWNSAASLSKTVRSKLRKETHILTKNNPRFIFGHGIKTLQ